MEVPVYTLSGLSRDGKARKLRNKMKAQNGNDNGNIKAKIAEKMKEKNAKVAAVLRDAAAMIESEAEKYKNGTLSGIDGDSLGAALKKAGKAVRKAGLKAKRGEGRVLKNTAVRAVNHSLRRTDHKKGNYIANVLFNAANYIKAVADMYDKGLIKNTLHGIYNEYLEVKQSGGTPTKAQEIDAKKAQVLMGLEDEPHYYQFAATIMPHVQDIDNQDGGYIFDNEDVANIAATGENALRTLEINNAPEESFGKVLKKIKKAVKKAAKKVTKAVKTTVKKAATATKKVVKAAVVNPTKAVVKSTKNAVKATANVAKATAQLATGRAKKAAATLKKAGNQMKKAVVNPVKTAVQSTKTIVKETVVKPIKATAKAVAKTIKIAGKIFKVIFIKLNPITVIMRNALRGLVALNFVGMATRLNVANMTKEQALAAGYTEEQYNSAVKAKKRVVNFFTKMGGKKANIEKAIVNGAKRKALFKKDYKPNQIINENANGEATLGSLSIGAALTAVGGFFAKIWQWIKKVVPKVVQTVKNIKDKVATVAQTISDKAGNVANALQPKTTDNTTDNTTIEPVNTTTEEKSKTPMYILLGLAAVGVIVMASKK